MIVYYWRHILLLVALCNSIISFGQKEVRMDITPPHYKKQWTIEEGLPQNSVRDIIQSKSGHIWIATNGGLAKFDGINFEIFDISNSPNLISNRIAKIIEDRSERIWAIHETAGISVYERGEFIKFGPGSQLYNLTATNLVADQDNNLWIGTGSGVIKINESDTLYFNETHGLGDFSVGSLLVDSTNTLWVSGGVPELQQGQLYRQQNNRFEKIEELGEYAVYTMTKGQNSIWIGSSDDIHQISQKKIRLNRFIDDRIKGIFEMAVTSKNKLLIGSQNGLFQYDLDKKEPQVPYIFDDPLNTTIKAIFEDNEGGIWIGTDGNGLVLLTPSPVTRYILPAGFNNKSINQIASDGKGGFWAGSQCAGLLHYSNNNFYHYNMGNNCIGGLLLDREENLLIATKKDVVTLTKNGLLKNFFADDTLKDSRIVNTMFQDRDGNYWLGTVGSGILVYNEKLIQHYTEKNGLLSNRIYQISQRKNGDILIGGNMGLSIIRKGKITNYDATSGLTSGSVRSIYEDENEVLWIGSYGGGLTRLSNQTLTNYNVLNGLSENVVSRIIEDEKGNLWMMGNFGLFFTSLEQLNKFANKEIDKINCITLGFKEGMTEGNGAGTAVQTKDGSYWWPTIEGIANIDISSYAFDTNSPKVIIKEYRVQNEVRPIKENGKIILSSVERDFEVRYNTLTFNQPDKIEYQYKLEGYDKNWIDAGNRRVINYTNISPGDYQLLIKASNRHGIWEDDWASIDVIVEPAIFETIWAQIFLILLSIAGIFGIFKWRISYLTLREKELETLVNQRTKALQTTLKSLEEAQGQLIQSEKLASIGTLTSGLAHELNNPLGYIGGIAHPLKMDIEEIKSFIPKERHHEFQEIFDEMNNLLSNLEDGVKKASGIIKNLQNISPDGDTEQVVKFNLSEILGTTTLLLQKSNPDTKILQQLEENAFVQANPIEINQLFQNIIQNSIEAISEPKGIIKIELKKSFNNVEVTIEDNGCGIKQEIIGQIFEPFFTTKRPGKSTGLGLYISYSIVKKYNGDIKVSSNNGCGATFKISLPMIKE